MVIYLSTLSSIGIVLSGKTLISTAICNKAIQAGMQVVEIANIRFKPELLRYLDELNSVVLFFDEFGKNFNSREQDKMLTLLSNITGKERIVIITENEANRISPFIRNRPGRIKYSLHFNKLPLNIVEEYCADFNVKNDFLKDFLEAYSSTLTFQFDHLQAIVDEHVKSPELPFKELIELLNIEGLIGEKVLRIISIKDKDGKEYKLVNNGESNMKLEHFEQGSVIYSTIEEITDDKDKNNYNRKFIEFSKNDIKSVIDDTIVVKVNIYEVIIKIIKE